MTDEHLKTEKTFDEFPQVNCNRCATYWSSGCDGVEVGQEKECRSFVATRNEDIPKQIKYLQTQQLLLWLALAFEVAAHFFQMLARWL